MNNIRKRVLAAGMVIMMVLSGIAGTTVYAAAKASLSQTKVTVGIGKTKIIKVKNAEKTVSAIVLSGKKNIPITRKKNSIKITGKKAGKAKLQVKTGGRKGSLAYYAPWGDVVMFYEEAGSASGLYELGTVVSGEGDISKLSGKITISKAD